MVLWSMFATLAIGVICVELRKLSTHHAELAQLVALIADNAKEGAGFVGDCRQRIERLERLLRIGEPPRVEGRN
jgi:hypothetical protein